MSEPESSGRDTVTDLTRWNRAGLARFDYVDGDAAVWLEELRITMLGLYMRGADNEFRTPDHWRDLYLKPKEEWKGVSAANDSVVWERLAPVLPPQQESRGRRTERLLKQYDENSGEYAWEINRAFARAVHVLLGHLEAYANEGYLRTATQWDNLRRLAAMVNYQPTPPASAITTVALELKDDAGAAEVARGLAMKHTPAEGGAPLIFETLQSVQAHRALNAARVMDWNLNKDPIVFGNKGGAAKIAWHLPEKVTLPVGDLVVVAADSAAEAFSIVNISHDTDAEADIELSGVPAKSYSQPGKPGGPSWWPTHLNTLHAVPNDVRVGLQRSGSGSTIVRVKDGAGFVKGDLVQVAIDGEFVEVEVLDWSGTELILDVNLAGLDEIVIRPMASYALGEDNKTKTDTGIDELFFPGAIKVLSSTPIPDLKHPMSHIFARPGDSKGRIGFASNSLAPDLLGKVERGVPQIRPGKDMSPSRRVSFEGKPPKGLANGDWFVARDIKSDKLKALRVEGVRTSSGRYHVLFSAAPEGAPEQTEFHGPMKETLHPVGHDRNPQPGITAAMATLVRVPVAAQALLKPGRKMILERTLADGTSEDILTTLTSIASVGATSVAITFEPITAGAGWAAGDTRFRLNCAEVSHGETKGSKTLGSGDGERANQVFEFSVGRISHIPSSSAESGVAPDIDVAVDGVRWDYRDYIDPDAEGAKVWSTTLTEDGNLRIHFRRRLPTGRNNISVDRHRVGVGQAGTGIAPLSFTKPMKKDRHVEAIYQPFESSGGADREPVAKLRTTAPSRLAANGRAVSLRDFESLARAQASVLRARAEEIPTPSATRDVLLTLVPAGGGKLTGTLEDTLRPAILAKAIPGVRLSFGEFETLPLHLGATVRADLSSHDKSDIKAAAEIALRMAFSLETRDFAQPVYVAEVLAALETVPGVENAVVSRFDLGDDYDLTRPKPIGFGKPWPKNVATRDDSIAAIYPTDHQVAYVRTPSGGALADTIAILVEGIK